MLKGRFQFGKREARRGKGEAERERERERDRETVVVVIYLFFFFFLIHITAAENYGDFPKSIGQLLDRFQVEEVKISKQLFKFPSHWHRSHDPSVCVCVCVCVCVVFENVCRTFSIRIRQNSHVVPLLPPTHGLDLMSCVMKNSIFFFK